jgi:hypothetical protein
MTDIREIKNQKDLDEVIDWANDGLPDSTILIRQNNLIIQLLFDLKLENQFKFNK